MCSDCCWMINVLVCVCWCPSAVCGIKLHVQSVAPPALISVSLNNNWASWRNRSHVITSQWEIWPTWPAVTSNMTTTPPLQRSKPLWCTSWEIIFLFIFQFFGALIGKSVSLMKVRHRSSHRSLNHNGSNVLLLYCCKTQVELLDTFK